ncbi:MAG: glycosyltransferase family 39 protein [Candidatus Ratteibacteria bacterium]|jgi:MFS family permease
MIEKREILFLSVLLVIFGYLCFYGIGWGVPGEYRKALVFSSPNEAGYFLEPMKSARANIYEKVGSFGEFLSVGASLDAGSERVISIHENGGLVKKVPLNLVNSLRSYLLRSYGADEQRAVIALSNFRPLEKKFNPHFFQYGGAYLYPLALTVKLADFFKFLKLQSSIDNYLEQPVEMGKVFIAGRCLGALAAVCSLLFFYLFVRLLFDKKTALFASFFYAFCPAVILWAHYLKPYAYVLFWFNGGLFFIAYVLKREKWRSAAVLAAVFSGLAAGTLVVYGYLFLGLILAVFLAGRSDRRPFPWRFSGVCLAVFLGVFLLVNPCLVPSFREFLLEAKGVSGMWQFGITPERFTLFFGGTLRYGLGTPLWFAAAFGLVLAVLRHSKEDIFLVLLLVPFLVYGASSTTGYAHYILPFFAIMALLAVRFLVFLLSLRKARMGAGVYLIFTLLFTAFYGIAASFSFREPNTRDIAGKWIKENIPYGSMIAMPDLPSPWRTPAFPFAEYRLAITGLEERVIQNSGARFFIFSEYHWLRNLPKKEIIDILRDCGYTELKMIEKPTKLGPFIFRRGDDAPSDWCHPNPTFIIYQKRTKTFLGHNRTS